MTCKLYLRMRMKGTIVKEQVQWMLMYVQERSADVWKKNVLEDLKAGVLEFKMVEKFLEEIKKELGGGEDEKAKNIAKLNEIEQVQ